MDPLGRVTRPNGLWPVVFALVLAAAVACQPDERSASSSEPHDAAFPIAPLSPSALQIAPDQLSRIELLTSGEHSLARRVVLEKRDDDWQIVSPIKYRANPAAVESMVAVMAG